MTERIAKFLAHAGVASRRDAERMIEDGRVAVDGRVLDSPAFTVSGNERITVDGQPVARRDKTRLFVYHKPKGLVTTHRDEKGRDTVFDHLPPELPRLVSVGRLDMNSEGLLLLTNNGELARHLELPATGWVRRYRVRIHGHPDAAAVKKLQSGMTVDGVRYQGMDVDIEGGSGANCWVNLGLREGKNREIRKVMDALNLPVTRLIRVSYGPFQLGELERGRVREVPAKTLREQLPGFAN